MIHAIAIRDSVFSKRIIVRGRCLIHTNKNAAWEDVKEVAHIHDLPAAEGDSRCRKKLLPDLPIYKDFDGSLC